MTGLKTGITYTVKVVTVPEGYETFTDAALVIAADGTVSVDGTSLTNNLYEIVLEAKSYDISGGSVDGGSVDTQPQDSAKYGQTVKIIPLPDLGYYLVGVDVSNKTTGAKVTVENNQFTMPAAPVKITPRFVMVDYTVTLTGTTGHITNAADFRNKTANYGNTVTIEVANVPLGYKPSFSGVTVTPPAGSVEGSYTFTMPASNVTITASLVDAFTQVKDDLYKDENDNYYQKDSETGELTPVHVHTAEVGGETQYTVFTPFDGTNDYPDSGNYYMTEDLTYTRSFYFGKNSQNEYLADNVTLCMNGKTLTNNATGSWLGLFVVYKDSSLTVIDCTGNGEISVNRPIGSVFQMYEASSSLVVKDITATNTGGYGVHAASNDVSVELENVTVNITGGDNYSSAVFAGGNRKYNPPIADSNTIAYSNVRIKIIGGEFTVTNQYAKALSFRDDGAAGSTSSAVAVEDAKFKGNISVQTKVANPGTITLEDCDITGSVEVYAGAATLHGGKVDGWVYLQRTYGESIPSILLLNSKPEITKSIYVYNSGRDGASVYNKQYLIISDDMARSGPYPVDLFNQRDSGYEFLFAQPDANHIDLSDYVEYFTTPYNYTVRHNEDDPNLYIYIYPYISDRDGDGDNEVDSNNDGIYEGSKDEDENGPDNFYLPNGEGGYIEVNPDTDGDGIYEDDEGVRYIPVDTSEPADGKYDDVIIDEVPTDGIYEDDEGNRYIPVDTSEPADGKHDDLIVDTADPETEKGDGIFEDDSGSTYVPDDNVNDPDKIIENEDGSYSEDVDGDGDIDENDDGGDTFIPDQDGDEVAEKVEKNEDGSYTDTEDGKHYIPDPEEEKEFIEVTPNPDGSYTDPSTGVVYKPEDDTFVAYAATPVIAPNGGTFSGTQTVTITTGTIDAVIYYTTDDTEPSAGNGIEYTGGFTINSTTKIKAIALRSDLNDSGIAEAEFTLSSGGGGAIIPSICNIIITDSANGTVTASHTSASAGTTITLTVLPDNGCELNTLTVTDEFGNVIALTEKSDGTYTFGMPGRDVYVNAAFISSSVHNCPSKEFSDVNTDLWYHEAIDFVLWNEYMIGMGNGRFQPNSKLSRAMIVQVLYNMEGQPEVNTVYGFTDVAPDAWYADAVNWAAANEIVKGYGETFGPNDPITREQMAAILYRYADFKGIDVTARGDLSVFKDGDKTSFWATDAMRWAIKVGLMIGRPNGTLDPTGTATRAEVAQIFMNYCKNILGE